MCLRPAVTFNCPVSRPYFSSVAIATLRSSSSFLRRRMLCGDGSSSGFCICGTIAASLWPKYSCPSRSCSSIYLEVAPQPAGPYCRRSIATRFAELRESPICRRNAPPRQNRFATLNRELRGKVGRMLTWIPVLPVPWPVDISPRQPTSAPSGRRTMRQTQSASH